MKKLLSLSLAVVLAAASLTALSSCGKKEPVLEKRTNVYAGEEIALPAAMDYIQNVFSSGNTVSMMYTKTYTVTYNELGNEVERTPGYNWDELTNEGWYRNYESQEYLAQLSVDTGELTEVPVNLPVSEDGTSSTYMNRMACAPDGTVWAMLTTWEYTDTGSTTTYSLRPVDMTTGEMGEGIVLNTALVNAGLDENNLYVNNFAVGDNGTIYINAETTIVGIGADGTFREKIEVGTDGWMNGMYVAGNTLYVQFYPNNGRQTLKVIENGQTTDIATDTLSDVLQTLYTIHAIRDGKMYYTTSTGVSTYDFATDTAAEILNYINSDIDSNSAGNMVLLPDGRIVMIQNDWSQNENVYSALLLSRVPDEQLQEEIILDLGCIYSDYNLTKAIIRFNKRNTGVRVSVRDYSQYNNEENEWRGAVTQFNNDIVTGKIPDIVMLSSELPADSYFQKGLFADLYQFMDDPEIGVSRADYLENILKACEVDGKLRSMILSFSINTLAAKSKFVGTDTGWTLSDMMNAIRSAPEGMSAFMEYSRQDILDNFFRYSMDTFVDWETGETHFTDAGFLEFIEYLKTCPEKGFWDSLYGEDYVYDEELEKEYSQKMDLRFYKDYSMFYMAHLSTFTQMMNARNQFATKDITFVGYPTSDEASNGATIVPNMELAISAQSLAQKEAWEFIKYVLNDEQYNEDIWTFTTNIRRLEDKKATSAEDYYYYEQTEDDLAWYKEYYSEEYYQYMKERNQPLDETTFDLTMDIIKGATKVQRNDDALLDIINEELSAFFAGTRSAEETAKIIDSRANIYVAENS